MSKCDPKPQTLNPNLECGGVTYFTLLGLLLMQNFTTVLNLIKEAFFKHGDENILKTCIKVLLFAAHESQGDLQDSANRVIKEIADDLLVKLRSSISQAGVSISH